MKIKTPSEIKAYLDQYVIGQEEAKIVLSVAVYNHYKRLDSGWGGNVEMKKSNIFLLGETGSGKTLLAQTIAKMLDVPIFIQDCTKITQSGYVGSDVEDCLVGLLRNCNYNTFKAEQGIIVLDEVDKIAKKDSGVSITRDVSGEGVQQSLLKIVEGDLVGVPPQGGRKHPEQSLIYINTKNILFIASGAFVGLDQIVRKRLNHNSVGFEGVSGRADNRPVNSQITPHDLRQFGMIPEFVGRFPIITHVDKLSKESLVRILHEPKNSLVQQYTELLRPDKTDLSFTPEALQEIAGEAYYLGTGARGLRNIFERVMLPISYLAAENRRKRLPKHISIDRETVVRSRLPVTELLTQMTQEVQQKKKTG